MNTRNHSFRLEEKAKSKFLTWWNILQSEIPPGWARADRAVLRRATDLTAVACTPAYQQIYREMEAAHISSGGAGWLAFQQERIAALVGLAVHVPLSFDGPDFVKSLPQAMSHRSEGDDRNPVSDLRFKRLLESPDIDALFTGLRRSLPLIDGKVSITSLADDIFEWNDAVKKRWAYAYQWTPNKKAST